MNQNYRLKLINGPNHIAIKLIINIRQWTVFPTPIIMLSENRKMLVRLQKIKILQHISTKYYQSIDKLMVCTSL